MHLITSDIAQIGNQVLSDFCMKTGINPKAVFNSKLVLSALPRHLESHYIHSLDFGAAAWIALRAQTFIFDTAQVLAFINSIDRALPPGDYHAPFEHMCFQFPGGIDEKLFTTGLQPRGQIEPGDKILGIMLSIPNKEQLENAKFVSVVAWYKSTAMNRAQLPIDGNGEISYEPLGGDGGAEQRRDKQRLANLAMLCLAYLTTPGMEIEKIETPERVNKKRARDGKRQLPDYYICKWAGSKARSTSSQPGQPTGIHHSFRYDVTGHFRRLPDGRTIWIKTHQRGLEHEKYVPKVYKVE